MSMLAERKRKTKWVLLPKRGPEKPIWTTETEGIKFGKKLMEKMGWSAGKGLGASEQGIQEPLRVSYKNDTKGMGFKMNDEEWISQQDEFNDLLTQLSADTSGGSVEIQKPEIKSLEEKSKKSKSRVHYKKFTRGKDLSQYSENDLACILGTNKVKPDVGPIKGKSVEPDALEKHSEHSFGVKTIQGGSIKDYFSNKWAEIKRQRQNKQCSHEEIISFSKNNVESPVKFNNVESETECHEKKVKKRKRSCLDDDMSNNVDGNKSYTSINYDNTDKGNIKSVYLSTISSAKEMQSSAILNNENINTEVANWREIELKETDNVGDITNSLNKEKKVRVKKVDVENSVSETDISKVFMKKKKKLKSNQEMDTDIGDKTGSEKIEHYSSAEIVNVNESKKERKKKKKKNKRSDTEEENNSDVKELKMDITENFKLLKKEKNKKSEEWNGKNEYANGIDEPTYENDKFKEDEVLIVKKRRHKDITESQVNMNESSEKRKKARATYTDCSTDGVEQIELSFEDKDVSKKNKVKKQKENKKESESFKTKKTTSFTTDLDCGSKSNKQERNKSEKSGKERVKIEHKSTSMSKGAEKLEVDSHKFENKNVIHTHKANLFLSKKDSSFFPQGVTKSKALRLMYGAQVDDFKGSNLANLEGYGKVKKKNLLTTVN